ncbi:amino acid/amide ABC transporter substrate-binding protein (HAAT family) [Sphaerotilus hippei]|uniref:Amino acid/amide ABC transporter substrate-binding protein (HAAT family) n=1 Tax=Sphaerotilus hippei TaxID=744406 RepID=A0A318H1U7_9BURK|nr:ABC transporter substrate-binding protein [Sphaerotilus hippei]PXW97094.1 amino acid/amide ABC transporter substrate-binding protein (HAAT family) [Sphaerotilus hippei]
MTLKSLALAAALVATGLSATLVPGTSFAQAKEQFFPLLVYRTGPYAPNGVPWANGKQDYLKMINARDGGVNGVKLTFEECETGYATDKGVECYERLKGKGASLFDPQATGITFALTDKVPNDKIPLITLGYGLAASQDGGVFKWNFPLMGSYWTAADILIQHLGKQNGGLDKLKGKKIALVYHDSPFGKEPMPLLEERSKTHGFELVKIPVTAPGVEQKSAWLQVRQQRPDYVLLWGWGVMNSTALKEAQATGYPRDKMYGVWWAGAEPDVKDVGEGAKGYNALALNTSGQTPKVIQDILKLVHDKGQGSGPKDEVGSVLYARGVIIQALGVEAVRRAQERFGKGKVMTGEQVRWGLENLALDDKKLAALGLTGVIRPVSTSCQDHMGSSWARVHTWDGAKWSFSSDWYQADEQILKPMIKAASERYATEKKLTRRAPADCQS